MGLLADIMEEAARIEDDKMRGEYLRMEIRTLQSTIKLLSLAADQLGDSSNVEDFTAQEENSMRTGKKIQAIRYVRERTGAGLSDAKLAVENWMQSNKTQSDPGAQASTANKRPRDFRDYMP